MDDPQTTKSPPSSQMRVRFWRMLDDLIFQIEDDHVRNQLEAALKREWQRAEERILHG